MNLAISETFGRARRRVYWQSVSIATGLALAAGTALVLGRSPVVTKVPPGVPRNPSIANVERFRFEQAPTVFYLVGDELQADKVTTYERLAQMVRYDMNVGEPYRSFSVVIIGQSLEEELAFLETVSELRDLGTNIEIVDVRDRS